MRKRYKEKDVKALVARLKEEYEETLRSQRVAAEEIKEENRRLRARLSVLESQRGEVSAALMRAVAEGERIKKESTSEAEGEKKELLLLAEKCRILSERLLKKYPDEEDCADFKTFTDALRRHLGEEVEGEEEDSGFDLDEVLNPKKPLDLGDLCRELGLMEEES